MPATDFEIGKIINDPQFTPGEKQLVLWQFGKLDSFEKALWKLISLADETNLNQLELGFSREVVAFRSWAYGDLGDRFRKAGLNI